MRHLFHLLFLLLLFFSFSSCRKYSQLKRHEFSHGSMGSVFKIICFAEDSVKAEKTALQAFSELDSLNLKMSDYLPYSELQKLCRTAGQDTSVQVSEDLFKVLALSACWSDKSDGDFDVSIGVLSQLWRRAGRKEKMPSEEDITSALKLVDYNFIKLDSTNQTVRLLKEDMFLDLGGIAKGYAVDRIFEIFQQNGYDKCLVDGGGDIRAGNPPPGEDGWRISSKQNGSDTLYLMSNKAVATSGDLYRFTEFDGVRYSHIIDPGTGYGLKTRREVTVIAENCTKADVLASILSIKGYPEGFDFLDKLENVSAVIYEMKDGRRKKYIYGVN